MSIVAFIPLRAGGKRVGFDKETAMLGNLPLMAYTIKAAIHSGVFDDVIAVTASDKHAEMAEAYGASVPFRRPDYTTRDDSPDIEWVKWVLNETKYRYSIFSILRVTSPFRTADNIREAYEKFDNFRFADSLRTVRKVSEHPGKMWVIRNDMLLPLLPMGPESEPWHSRATQKIFDAYVQTAGMEFAWTETAIRTGTIAGSIVLPYIIEGPAALDINTLEDWKRAESMLNE